MSLYSKLFRLALSDRENLENFLTEILGHFLNELSPSTCTNFCCQFLLGDQPSDRQERWLALLRLEGNLTWKTQAWIEIRDVQTQKRPDLILYTDKIPILILECKIGAPLTAGVLTTRAGSKPINQLELYDRWLFHEGGPDAALVLLTQYREAPTGFLNRNSKFRLKTRAVRRWNELSRWLETYMGHSDGTSSGNFVLARELNEFLLQEGLVTSEPTEQDLAAARLYLSGGAHARISDAMSNVRRVIRTKFHNLKNFPNKPPEFESALSHGVIWDSCTTIAEISLVWGLYFGSSNDEYWSKHLEPRLPHREGGFVYIGFPNLVPRGSGAEGWHFPTVAETTDPAVAKFVDIRELGDNFTAGFANWLSLAVDEANSIIKSSIRQPSPKGRGRSKLPETSA